MPRRKLFNTSADRRAISTEEGIAAATEALKIARKNGVECALCGGLAMQLYGFTRATRDVDFIASNLLPLKKNKTLTFGGEGYAIKVGGKKIPLNWIVRDDEKQEIYEAALKEAIETPDKIPIVSPEWLVVMKQLAGRGKDHLDLLWLLREDNLVDRKEVERLVKSLLGRYAYLLLNDLKAVYLEADLMRARDEELE
jgi:hypothetical protein